MIASGSRVIVNADANLVLRIEESWYSKQFSGANTPGRQLIRGAYSSVALPAVLGDNVIPAGATFVVVAGRAVLNVVSAAGVNGRVGNTADQAAIPIAQQFQVVGSLAGILANRPLRQYIFQVPVRRTVAGTAILELGLVVGTNFVTLVGTPPGVIFSSNPAVNAGRWLPRTRQVNGGALVDGADTGVSPSDAGFHLLGFRYTEGPVPLIEWMIDNVPRHTISGDAAMPVFPGGVNHPGFVPGYGVGTPAGSTWQFGPALYEIRNLG